MKHILIIACLFISFAGLAQTDTTKRPPQVYNFVEVQPKAKFDLPSYLGENLHYPREARQNGIEGRVIVKFVVNEDGSVSNVTIVRGIGGGCDEEAKKVVANMPAWTPGTQNGKPVKVYFTLPIQFKLEDGPKRKH